MMLLQEQSQGPYRKKDQNIVGPSNKKVRLDSITLVTTQKKKRL